MTGIQDGRIVRCILDALQNAVSRIVLYGPAARMESSRDGAAELAVITPYKISEFQEERLSLAVADFNKKHDRKYSVIDIDAAALAEMQEEIPLFREILETGIPLWKQEED